MEIAGLEDLRKFEAFLSALTPQARKYVLDWLISPWTMGDLLEGESDGEVVLQELTDMGVIRLNEFGSPELCYTGDWK
jgi:hypothetical protein